MLEPVLVARITELAAAADFVARASVLLDVVKDRTELRKNLGAHILRVRPDLRSATGRQDRALARKADARATSCTTCCASSRWSRGAAATTS